ncbi:hypothetical protein YM304_33910 [Ilumatobacter coccineus YM16-304]|uniref:Uncharacterized protein n=1 Tax=Ilumatobacter coccineus (strain NBRC 103263 / KCTC 29153 / YM16-304) TaxID=1313172 RepID=A0A6C7EF98_ILUCY|nr:hypothetical protein YM304_33910 [Ilumatobacter coccineus YM16-304]
MIPIPDGNNQVAEPGSARSTVRNHRARDEPLKCVAAGAGSASDQAWLSGDQQSANHRARGEPLKSMTMSRRSASRPAPGAPATKPGSAAINGPQPQGLQ